MITEIVGAAPDQLTIPLNKLPCSHSINSSAVTNCHHDIKAQGMMPIAVKFPAQARGANTNMCSIHTVERNKFLWFYKSRVDSVLPYHKESLGKVRNSNWMLLFKILFFWADVFALGSSNSEGARMISKKKNSRPLFTIIFRPKIVVSRVKILVHSFQQL